MRHGVLLLSLAAGLLACSDADPIRPPEEEPAPEPRPAKIEEMRVVKVRGDQSVQVPPPEVAGPTIRAVVGQDGWTSEPLVARIVVQPTGGLQVLQADGDSVYVPKGTLVHWHLSDGCGRLFAATTATDDSAVVVNRWAPGTKAGTCTATAGRLVGTEIVYDAEFELEVLPGPVVDLVSTQYTLKSVRAGDTVDYSARFAHGVDAYGNPIPKDEALAQVTFRWAITPLHRGTYLCYAPEAPDIEPQGEGWLIPVPDEAAGWERLGEWNACLWTWYPELGRFGGQAILVY